MRATTRMCGHRRYPPGQAITLTVAAIPEPDTYTMMLAGLGLMGFIARRKKQKEAA